MLGGFVLELSHPGQLAKHGVAVEYPAQLRVGRDMRLDEESVFFRIQAAGDVLGQLLQRAAPQGGGVLPDGDGVHICHKIVAVELLGPGGPIFDGTQVVTQVQISAGLDAGEHYFFFVHLVLLLYFRAQRISAHIISFYFSTL